MQATSTTKRNVIGLLGGTFDPLHFGHLRLAQELAESLLLSNVRFIPAAQPPHKTLPLVGVDHRAAMVYLGISSNPLFSCDERELHRGGASYTIDTLHSLRNDLGADVSLVLLMGSDAFASLHSWYRWQEIIQLCHIALVQRPSSGKQETLPKTLQDFLQTHYTEHSTDLQKMPAGFIIKKSVTALDISSTAIRKALQHKQSVRYLLPDSIIDYIHTNQLYRN